MALTDDELDEVRDWITWDPPDDGDLDAAHDVLKLKWAVVVKYLRRRLSELIAAPAQFTVQGDWSQNTTANITALQSRLAEAEANLADEESEASGGTAGIGRLTRFDPVRDCWVAGP